MKKFILILFAIALVSCTKGIIDEYGGSDEPEKFSIAENYLTIMATDLLPDYLIALESALSYDNYGYYTYSGKSDYETDGKSLRVKGNKWTVNAKKKVNGLIITCKGNDTWELYREGPYSYFSSDKEADYITTCLMTATIEEDLGKGHYDWKVTFEGSRVEREGYSCKFRSEPEMVYRTDQTKSTSGGWGFCYGSATILVEKNGEKIDLARMDYNGKLTNFFRGL